MKGLAHRAVDREEGRHGVGLLPGHDAEQAIALLRIRPHVEDRLHLALALVHGPRPPHGEGHVEPVEARRPETAPVDPEEADGPAMAVRRQRVELARATVGAVAVAELEAVNFPIDHESVPLLPSLLRAILRPSRPGGNSACTAQDVT